MFTRTIRLRGMAATLLGLALLLGACAAEDPFTGEPEGQAETPAADDPGVITVGSANFPEALILGNMFAMALEAEGFEVDTRLNLGSREVYFPALEAGEIDLLAEYTGALLGYLTGGTDETDTDTLVTQLRDELDDEDIVVLDPAPGQNRNALVVTPETAEHYGLETVSDLAPVADELVLGGAPEARERFTGLPGLKEVYGIEFKEFRDLDPGGPLTIEALDNGDIDVARLFTTQGVIDERGWIVLEEDRPLIPAENIIPVIRREKLTDGVAETLNALVAELTTETLTELNRRVEIEREDPDAVAEDWLRDHGFIG